MVLFTINPPLDPAIRLLLTATRSALICQFAMMSLTTWEKATPTLEKTAGPSLMQMAMNWRLALTRMALRTAHLETALVDVQMPPLATTTLKPTLMMALVPNLMNVVNVVVQALRMVHAIATAMFLTSAAFVVELALQTALATATAMP
jgi:hypothetical protein